MLIWLILLLAVPAVACDPGCKEMGGVCACEAPTEKAVETDKPSDEQPRRGQQPEWETGDVKADMGVRASTTAAAADYQGEKDQR